MKQGRTIIEKNAYGWYAETQFKNESGNGGVDIVTMKRYRGNTASIATPFSIEGDFKVASFDQIQSGRNIIDNTYKRTTKKKIVEQHEEAVTRFIEFQKRAKAEEKVA